MVSAKIAEYLSNLNPPIVADNNDYVFVQIPKSNEVTTTIGRTDRYKFNGSSWTFEYSLDTNSFTERQWAAINSGATQGYVERLRQISAKVPKSQDRTWEEENEPGDNAGSHCLFNFKTSAFGAERTCALHTFTFRSSSSKAPCNQDVFLKIFDPNDRATSLATSNGVRIDTRDKDFTFTFSDDAYLEQEKWYIMEFHEGLDDDSPTINVDVRLTGDLGTT